MSRLRAAGLLVPVAAIGAILLTSTGASPERPAPVAQADGPYAVSDTQRDQAAARRVLADRTSARQVSRSAGRTDRTVETVRTRQETARREAARRAREAAQAWVPPLRTMHRTSGFGHRWGRLHAGVDFSVSVGTPVRAMSTGTVTAVGRTAASGNRVEIEYWDGTVCHYYHLSSPAAKPGQHVSPGKVVGYSGNTGRSTGPHLHLEIHPGGGRPVDPMPWLAAHGLT